MAQMHMFTHSREHIHADKQPEVLSFSMFYFLIHNMGTG